MMVAVELGDTFRAGTPRPLFLDPYERDNSAGGIGGVPNYDITPNGQRFVMVRVDRAGQDHVVVVLNWHEELKARVPID